MHLPFFFTQTNGRQSARAADGAIIPADGWVWCGHTLGEWLMKLRTSELTHKLHAHLCTMEPHTHTHTAVTQMTERGRLIMSLPSRVKKKKKNAGRREAWHHRLRCLPEFSLTDCQTADSKINRRLNYNGFFFPPLSLCSMCQFHCDPIFPPSTFYRLLLRRSEWIFFFVETMEPVAVGRMEENMRGCGGASEWSPQPQGF